MNEKIYDLLNDVKTDLNEYESHPLSSKEARQIETRLLQEVRSMKKENRKNNKKATFLKAAVSAAACAAVLLTVSSQPNAKEFLSGTFQKLIAKSADEKYAEEQKELYTHIGKNSTQLTSDTGETIVKEKQTQSQVLKAKDAGVTVRASDVYCDGYMLYYTLVLETENKTLVPDGVDGIYTTPNKESVPSSIRIDGEYDGAAHLVFQKQQDGSFITVQNCCLYSQPNPKTYRNGDILPIDIDLKQFYGVDYDKHDKEGEYVLTEPLNGEWKLSIPVTVETEKNRTQKINKEDNQVKLISVTKAKATLNLELQEPDYTASPYNDKYNDPDIAVKDADGNFLQWAGCYEKMNEDGSRVHYITVIDTEKEGYTLEVTNKNVDGELIAQIDFLVER